jgi:hypothetical protein
MANNAIVVMCRQVGFFDMIVLPLVRAWAEVFPECKALQMQVTRVLATLRYFLITLSPNMTIKHSSEYLGPLLMLCNQSRFVYAGGGQLSVLVEPNQCRGPAPRR